MTGNLTVLLTGATGLVGRFVLAELLRRQVQTIVLVRAQPTRDVYSRIDEALSFFEQHQLLPRPIVLEADLGTPGLGLSHEAWQVLKSQPLRILHSAASIRFQAESPEGEPYRSNVNGTRNLLEVTNSLHVKQFHYVSTAYVQCDRRQQVNMRERTAFEVPVTSTALAGNDYERSKILSENLVQRCPHVGPVSIYRPSIVVGDSRSGYTSTYHGFYAPLQIAAGLIRSLGIDRSTADLLREQLGLENSDSKNLVPVDWLALAIVELMETPAALGGIYHLTHPQPAKLHDMQSAILDALAAKYGSRSEPESQLTISATSEAQQPASSGLEFGQTSELFSQQMAVYESYFQDDPPFDRSRTNEFLADLPCPVMDRPALRRLAEAALQNNFGWPRPPAAAVLHQRLAVAPDNVTSTRTGGNLRDFSFELQILGPHQSLSRAQATVGFCRTAGRWQLNSVLSSNVTLAGVRLVTTEQSLLEVLPYPQLAWTLLERGRLTLSGPWPPDWFDIVKDWIEHLRVIDDLNRD